MNVRTPLRARVQSPGLHLLTPNDDDLEREQVRMARAAVLRRKSGVAADTLAASSLQPSVSQEESQLLSTDHLRELLSNCMKLAAANKITPQNTWGLKLIDHLSELINSKDDQTNFQQASCTLEAGVKIYSTRVDSVHSQTYKVLGGLNRTAWDDKRHDVPDEDGEDGEGGEIGEHNPKDRQKDSLKKTGTHTSTLEASLETLNVKKFDVAFTVDPLFHITSAQFDEGGAKGLLLNNLSVYQGCEIIFDSWEVPEISMKAQAKNDAERAASIDLSFMKDCVEHMMGAICKEKDISPTLREIVKMLDDPYRMATEAEVAAKQADSLAGNEENRGSWVDGDEGVSVEDSDDLGEVFDYVDPNTHEQENVSSEGFGSMTGLNNDVGSWNEQTSGLEDEEDLDDGEVECPDGISQQVEWLTGGMDISSKSNAWAGPDHWKYRKPRGPQSKVTNEEDGAAVKQRRKSRQALVLAFEKPPEIDLTEFEPPSDPQSTLLRGAGAIKNTLLPEDCHYGPLDFLHYFLRPSVMCIRKRGRRNPDGPRQNGTTFEGFGYDSGTGDRNGESDVGWPDENGQSDVDDPFVDDLVAEPRKVQKIDVNYDKRSKQVDVHVLKEAIWECLQDVQMDADMGEHSEDEEFGIPFQGLLDVLLEDCPAAAPEDISVPLCFICLLHLANEHNMYIKGCPTLDDLRIVQVETLRAGSIELG